jgi:hypothetical protein
MIYGESDYWVAQYRSMTEGSAQQARSTENPHRSLVARGTALVAALLSSITRRGGNRKAGLDGRA